ncbi:MAG TPA: gamma-glutamyl-gamma-aminobutyrate hydrolase family protein [Gemmataceae bacterium]
MPRRPVIGIATQTQEAVPGQLPRCWIMSQKYVQVLCSYGAVPWLVPLLPGDPATLREVYERLDGVFLTGGVDVDPSHYGEQRHPKCGHTDPERDAVEMMFVRWALADYKPLLAVCRGFQVLNVACGGTLFQDVASQCPAAIKHDHFPTAAGTPTRDYLAHDIRVDPRTRLGRCLGAEQVPVNSMHHQGIKALAPALVPSAWAPDGLIEGAEGANGHYVVAVQWHPEELTAQDGQRRLFTEFLAAAGT